ncbi:alcohol dehydrogenase class-3-like isoform X1 [Engraulis encrasicolus]|uniref:alcohol dehydrogenase class-3-like isoform X1 n=2 Tax=Engraulis encrasicolus TaxID=184585 RepID=UPI002FD2261E
MAMEGKPIRCRAAVAWKPGEALSVEEVMVAPPKAHEVRIKVMASGVCHTDWAYLHGAGKGMELRPFPLVLGHEGAGVVESVGAGVTRFSPGDKVIPLFLPQCGECDCCLSPKTNLCKANWAKTQQGVLADGTSRISCRGTQVFQFLGVSSFSEYTVTLETNLTKIHPDAELDRVCLLGCGVATGYGAAVNVAKVEEGSVCVVLGLGAVGLAAVMGCVSAGAARVIGVDVNPDKFDRAREFGVTDCVNPRDHKRPIQDVLVEMTSGGADYALECVGDVEVMRSALESCRSAWGVCVIVGWTELEEMKLLPFHLLMGRTLKGTYFGGWKSVTDIPQLVEQHLAGRLKLDEFVTHTLTLDEVNHAFQLLAGGQSIRSIIKM